MDSTSYCQQLATPPGSNLYYALLFHEPSAKKKLLALFSLQLELHRTIVDCQDPGVARIKLRWWLEEIERLYAEQPRHPVSKLLVDLILENQLKQNKLEELVGVAEQNINPIQHQSFHDMLENNRAHQALTWQLASSVINQNDDERLAQLAALYASVENLKNALPLLNKGYCIFPSDLLEKHQLNADDLRCEPDALRNKALLTDLFSQLEFELNLSLQELTGNSLKLPLFALCLAGIARANCTLLLNQQDLRQLPASSITPLRKLWISWKTNRHYHRN